MKPRQRRGVSDSGEVHCLYFSHLEGSVRAPAAIAGFRSASGFIRREIGKSLGLRYTPELDFEFDPALERAARIDALLKQSAPKD
jgi:ribosome-binding factor A